MVTLGPTKVPDPETGAAGCNDCRVYATGPVVIAPNEIKLVLFTVFQVVINSCDVTL